MKRVPFPVRMFGFGVGGTLGGLALGLLGWWMLASVAKSTEGSPSPGAGFGLAFFGLMVWGGWILGTLICASIGTFLATRAWERRGWKPSGWSAYPLGTLPILAILGPFLYFYIGAVMASRESGSSSVTTSSRSVFAPTTRPETASSMAPEPTPQQLLGGLYYPGAVIDESSLRAPRKPGEPIWPAIAMVPMDGSTEASLRTFYGNLVSDGHEAYGGWGGTAVRPGDGKTVSILIVKAVQGRYGGRPVVAAILK